MLVTSNHLQWFKPPSRKIKSTVGAGDSMVAGIVLSLAKGNDVNQATAFGVACGTATTLNEGTQLFKIEDTEKMYRAIKTL